LRGAGADQLFGDTGDDQLQGDGGGWTDSLNGGTGADILKLVGVMQTIRIDNASHDTSKGARTINLGGNSAPHQVRIGDDALVLTDVEKIIW